MSYLEVLIVRCISLIFSSLRNATRAPYASHSLKNRDQDRTQLA